MRKIHLIRHAKSSWEDEYLADIDRPLNDRGIRTSLFMASHIHNAGCDFDNVFCSPATRAQSTIELISRCLPESDIQWETDNNLYTFNSIKLLDWCRAVDNSITEFVLIGHNPALTDLCNELSSSYIENLPTCGYAQLTAKTECNWCDIGNVTFELTTFLRPKKLMKK